MTKIRHLLHRDGRYYARLVVPQSLRSIVGARELREPLGADRRNALEKQPAAIVRIRAKLAEARAVAKSGGKVSRPARGRPLMPDQIARAHYDAELAADDAVRDSELAASAVEFNELFGPGYEKALRHVISGRASDDEIQATIGWAIDAFTARGNASVMPNTPKWRSLARMLAGVQIETLKRSVERDDGDYTGKPAHPALADRPALTATDPLAARLLGPDSEKPLSELVEKIANEKAARPATTYEYGVAARMLEEHFGEARPLYRITRRDMLSFKDALRQTPANYTKRFPGMALPDAIAANQKRKLPFPPLSAKTINDKALTHLRSMFNWCVSNDLIPDNPAAGVKVDQRKGTSPSREHFTPGDLALIFARPLFSAPLRERQWALLIAIFTGMRSAPVRCAVQTIAEAIGQLPVITYQRGEKGAKERAPDHPAYSLLHDDANEWTPASKFREELTRDALLQPQGGFAFINRVDGKPVELIRLDPALSPVTVGVNDRGEPTYTARQGGKEVRYPRENILHIPSPSLCGLVHDAREAIGLAIVMEGHAARLFGNGAHPSGVVSFPKEANLGVEGLKKFRAAWQASYNGLNSGTPAVIDGGGTWTPLTFTSVDAQFLEMRRFAIEEIARVFRVPPHMLFEMSRATWGNSEEMGQQFLTLTLLPWISRWQGEIRLKLFTPEERDTFFAEFLIDDLLRADFAARMDGYGKAVAARILNPNEARAMENRPPYEGGDKFENPNTVTAPAKAAE